MILLPGFILGLEGCQHVTIKNRNPCFVNGVISLGATCSNTVGNPVTVQLTTLEVLDMLESRTAQGDRPAHPPGVFQTADDYGEETIELEIACRLLGDNCTYELKSTIDNRKLILKQLMLLVR